MLFVPAGRPLLVVTGYSRGSWPTETTTKVSRPSAIVPIAARVGVALNHWATAIKNSTAAKSTVFRTYFSAVSRALVPWSNVAAARALSRFALS